MFVEDAVEIMWKERLVFPTLRTTCPKIFSRKRKRISRVEGEEKKWDKFPKIINIVEKKGTGCPQIVEKIRKI